MTSLPQNLRDLRQSLADGRTTPSALAQAALANSNQTLHHNTYLWQDAAWTSAEAARTEAIPRTEGGAFDDGRSALWGLPVSVKDCFDLAGAPTTCGVRFYRDLNGVAAHDSWLVEQLRRLGAVIVGKTHLHPLAYGITGENPEFGDCIQPGTQDALTGGSSSGAVASIMERSAVAAIGTDTGGSVRVPAALCGLAGYRSSLGRGDWRGGAHLAESFDTIGWLFRNLEDAPLLAAPFAPVAARAGREAHSGLSTGRLRKRRPQAPAALHLSVQPRRSASQRNPLLARWHATGGSPRRRRSASPIGRTDRAQQEKMKLAWPAILQGQSLAAPGTGVNILKTKDLQKLLPLPIISSACATLRLSGCKRGFLFTGLPLQISFRQPLSCCSAGICEQFISSSLQRNSLQAMENEESRQIFFWNFAQPGDYCEASTARATRNAIDSRQ